MNNNLYTIADILMTALLFVGGKMGKNPPSILQ